jgi:hypothetical protein
MKPETQIPNTQSNPNTQNTQTLTQQTSVLEFDAPCCESLRECSVRRIYIIGIRNNKAKILREIDAVRCYRGIRKKFKFYPSDDVVLARYYRSNRGNHHITILWKPQNMTEDQAKAYAALALGLYTEEEVVI